MGLRPTQEDEKHADQEPVGGMPNCSLLTGRDRRRAADISTRQAWLLMFIAPTSRYARYGAPIVFSSPPVECFRQSEAQWRPAVCSSALIQARLVSDDKVVKQ